MIVKLLSLRAVNDILVIKMHGLKEAYSELFWTILYVYSRDDWITNIVWCWMMCG